MIKTLQEAEHWLEQNSKPKANPERFSRIANKNNLLENKSKVITVAGTNGKGSTVACLEAILLESGYRVATYTSPHLIRLNERCKINGLPWDPSTFLMAFNHILEAYGDEELNGFECLTLVFLLLRRNEKLDYCLVEVGLGGRHCVTNLIEPDIAVITTIDLDHTEILGPNRDVIAYEKSGIFRSNKPAICGDPNPPQSLLDYASQVGANLLIQSENFNYSSVNDHWQWRQGETYLTDLPLPKIPLQNASTALAVLQFCQVSEAAIYRGLKNVTVPGRLQLVEQRPHILCDVAHNPQSCQYLAKHLLTSNFVQTYAVFTMKANKDIAASLEPLLRLIDHWFIYALPGEADFIHQAKHLLEEQRIKVTVCNAALSAFKKARAIATEDDRIIVFGSFKLVGEVLQHYAKD